MAASKKTVSQAAEEKEIKPVAEAPVPPTYEEELQVVGVPYKTLLKWRKSIDAEIERQKKQIEEDFRKKTLLEAEALGLSINKVFGIANTEAAEIPVEEGKTKRKRTDAGVKATPFYQNPNDASQVASRRGLHPKWMRDLLAEGVPIESLIIKND
ncbi:H-NS family nucleoid-associated regulatory protein [Candidatus Magnetaquicoccus inordinatus]|uniref:H-NS family nucleoid-associated regulatory protein n=1 Tax=Candidatus Magnetaquicoccus inordinatus TaxID=2496818 RepID=UPI00102AF0A8|nr:H-NS family nucleoid-associated regulatory protein [Candidatus Magnetaquicoccus inordinatus]